MDDEKVKQLRAEGNNGIAALKRRLTDRAGEHFNNALNLADEIEDERQRRDELATLSALFQQCGFPDLALMAAEEAVELDRALGLESFLGQDIISVGNAHMSMENTQKAQAYFEEALGMFVEQGEWANAASANTNLAAIVANAGEMPKAITMLETSLRYLAKEPFDNTETQTRFLLLQALEVTVSDVARAVENAQQLVSRFLHEMPPDQRQMTVHFVAKLAARYLEAHPQANADAWKAATFPLLFK